MTKDHGNRKTLNVYDGTISYLDNNMDINR